MSYGDWIALGGLLVVVIGALAHLSFKVGAVHLQVTKGLPERLNRMHVRLETTERKLKRLPCKLEPRHAPVPREDSLVTIGGRCHNQNRK